MALLGGLTKRVLETALEGEMDEHLGYAKGDPAGHGSGNFRSGKRAKTVVTAVGQQSIRQGADPIENAYPSGLHRGGQGRTWPSG